MSFGMSGLVFHAPFIHVHPQFELTAICERTKNLSKPLYPNTITVRSIDELLAMDGLELVVVNTPDSTHYEFAKRALEAGKHVIVEKPFTITVAEGEALIELARGKNLMLCVFQNRRWDADFLTVREIIETGKLGKLVEFESVFARYRNEVPVKTWKELEGSGSLTYNLGSHLIDQCLTLFGKPEAVFADIARLRDHTLIDDYFIIHLFGCERFPDIKITLKSGFLMREPEPRFVLHGTSGSYVKRGVDKQEELLKAGAVPDTPDWGVETEEEWGEINTVIDGKPLRGKYRSQRGDYTGFYDSVYQRLRNGQPLPTSAENVLPTIRIIEAAFESSRKRAVVKC
ncbi:MAG: Gfo/Idh/MocA family oxidoreductase [Tannerella sp.]|nr:Gfo/Idh/MocA family oxidoreductase [Tannerella sp.]